MPKVIEIADFAAPELDIYARLTEGQLKNRAEPSRGLFIAESPNVIHRALDAGYVPVSLLMERKHIDGQAREIVARCGDIPIYTSELEVLKELTGFPLTRGGLCAMRRRPQPTMDQVCAGASRIAVLEDEPHQSGCNLPFRRRPGHGRGAADPGQQRPAVPPGRTRQHGYGVPGALGPHRHRAE